MTFKSWSKGKKRQFLRFMANERKKLVNFSASLNFTFCLQNCKTNLSIAYILFVLQMTYAYFLPHRKYFSLIKIQIMPYYHLICTKGHNSSAKHWNLWWCLMHRCTTLHIHRIWNYLDISLHDFGTIWKHNTFYHHPWHLPQALSFYCVN